MSSGFSAKYEIHYPTNKGWKLEVRYISEPQRDWGCSEMLKRGLFQRILD